MIKNNNDIMFISLATIAIIGAFLVVYFTTKKDSEYVHASNCNAALGEFALEHGGVTNSVLKLCGASGTEDCTRRINNLTDAVNYCNLNSRFCDRFMYNSKAGSVSIVSLKGKITNSTDNDLFTRQVGLTYTGQGTDKDAVAVSNIGYYDTINFNNIPYTGSYNLSDSTAIGTAY